MTKEEILRKKELIFNRTRLYLVPELVSSEPIVLGTPIGWFVKNEHHAVQQSHIVGVYNMENINFSLAIDKVRKHERYLDDYVFNELGNDFYHCVTFSLDKTIYQKFIEGKYSTMYPENIVHSIYKNISSHKDIAIKALLTKAKKTLLKTEDRRVGFELEVNMKSKIEDSRSWIQIDRDVEYDFKPEFRYEVITINDFVKS